MNRKCVEENVDLLSRFRKFSLDDLLTNIMIYWTTGSIVSSMRFYKENLTNIEKRLDIRCVCSSMWASQLSLHSTEPVISSMWNPDHASFVLLHMCT